MGTQACWGGLAGTCPRSALLGRLGDVADKDLEMRTRALQMTVLETAQGLSPSLRSHSHHLASSLARKPSATGLEGPDAGIPAGWVCQCQHCLRLLGVEDTRQEDSPTLRAL